MTRTTSGSGGVAGPLQIGDKLHEATYNNNASRWGIASDPFIVPATDTMLLVTVDTNTDANKQSTTRILTWANEIRALDAGQNGGSRSSFINTDGITGGGSTGLLVYLGRTASNQLLVSTTANASVNVRVFELDGAKGDKGDPGTDGMDGMQGAPGNDGADGVSATFLGAWSSGTDYVIGNNVSVDGSNYACRLAHTSGAANQPGSGSQWLTYWQEAGRKGDTGAMGAMGNAGNNGYTFVPSIVE